MCALVTASPTIGALTARSLVALDEALRAELEVQRGLMDDAEAILGELSGPVDGGSADGRDAAERAMNHALDVIAEIEHALERIVTSTYGRCEGCGGAIPPARLEAIPFARTCVSCPPPTPLPRSR
jgi:RNA polymerase-binding transcription factor DksA